MTDSVLARGWPRAGIPRDLLLVVAVCSIVFFAGIGRTPLWDEDETRFASVAREMVRSGDWIVPRYNGELADKPAGLFWIISGSFVAFGESPAAARNPSALCALLTVVMVWILGVRLFGKTTAFWGSLATGTSMLFAVEARAATADSALVAVIAAMMVLASGAWWKDGRFVPASWPLAVAVLIGFLAGVGIMLKGLVALVVPLAAFALFFWWVTSPRGASVWSHIKNVPPSLRAVRPLIVIGTAVLVALPWHVAVGWKTGGAWLELFYWKHHLGRAVSVMEGHGGVPFLQIPLLFAGMFPWSVFLPLAVWRMGRSAISQRDQQGDAARFIMCWSAVWLTLFSLTATQLPNYVLPAYPALGLCVGHLVARAIECPASMRNGWFYAACAGLFIGAAVFVAGFWALSEYFADPTLRILILIACIPIVAAVGLGGAISAGRRAAGAGIFTAASAILLLALFLFAAPQVSALDPIPSLIKRADASAQGRARLGTWRFSAPGVVWSAGRPAPSFASADEAARFLESAPGDAFLLVDEKGLTELHTASRCGIAVLADGLPLFRRGRVLLVAAE